jgi:predicted Zn-dependent peptidase
MNEPILSHTFPNGLALVAEPMGWLRSAAFAMLVPAGAAYDPPQLAGLSNFTCEMTLRGAGNRDSRQFVLDLDNLGVERQESVSGAHIAFGGATLAENLPAALRIFADVLRRPHLPEEQLEAGRQVVLQELRAVEDEPSDKAMIELRRRHYPAPWGRPTQGELQALESIDSRHIGAFFQRQFQPKGAIIGVAGHIDWEAIKDLVGQLLGDWQPVPSLAIIDQPPPRGYQHIAYESNQTQIGIAYDSVPYCHPDYFQAWGAVGALSGGMSARLFTEVRERRGLCYSIHASYHTLRHRGAVLCYAGTSAERSQETLDVTIGELVRLAGGVEEHELNRLKARIKNALIMQQESSSARAGGVARDWYHLGRARTLDELSAIVDGLTAASINAYLAEHPPQGFTVVTLGPKELIVPSPSGRGLG